MSDSQPSNSPTVTVTPSPSSDTAPTTRTVEATPKSTTLSPEVTPGSRADAPAAEGTPQEPATPKDAKEAARFKELSRRDKEARETLRAAKELAAKYGAAADMERLAKEDPDAFAQRLEAMGWTYETWTDRILSGGRKDPDVVEAERRIAALEKERQDERRAAEQAKVDATISGFKQSIRAHVDSPANADAYELVRAEGAYDDVYELIEQHYMESKELWPVDRAAALVEDYLLGEAKRIAQAKKVRALYAPEPAGAGDSVAKREQPGAAARPGLGGEGPRAVSTPVPTTITNGVASSANPSPQSFQRTKDEARERAIAALNRVRDSR